MGSMRSFVSLRSAACALALAGASAAQAVKVISEQKISETTGGFGGVLNNFGWFGKSVDSFGDFDGDGVGDLLVGHPGSNGVWILLLNPDGTVASEQKVVTCCGFGSSVASLGDVDGDGKQDIVGGAPNHNPGGIEYGAVFYLSLNSDGTVYSQRVIFEGFNGFDGDLDQEDMFGFSIAPLGDLDGDGVGDLAVGAIQDDDGGTDQGAVWILFMNSDGTVASEQKISATVGGFGGDLDPYDGFGISVRSLGDLDGDGLRELAVGAPQDDDGGGDQGALWILSLNPDGTVASERKISATTGGFGGLLLPNCVFGWSLATLGDLDGDGIEELAVGAIEDADGGLPGESFGAVWILFLNPDGSVASEQKISQTAGGFGGDLDSVDLFGYSATSLGDLDGDGKLELAVGAVWDDDGGTNQGAVWILSLRTGLRPGPSTPPRPVPAGPPPVIDWR